MKLSALVLIVAVLLLASFVWMLASARSDLDTSRSEIATTWTAVSAALDRRSEVVSNFLEAVAEIASNDAVAIRQVEETQSGLASVRSPADRIRASQALDGALGRLLLAVENYPKLRSSDRYLRAQEELVVAENQIAVERRKYNEQVARYNTSLELFPANAAAWLFGFQRNDNYFQTEPAISAQRPAERGAQ
jgi:LemA protein